jgi:hypothetical protein
VLEAEIKFFAIFRHHDQVSRRSSEDGRIQMRMMCPLWLGKKLRRSLRNEKKRVMRRISDPWLVAKS